MELPIGCAPPDYPELDRWRMTCVQEGLPVPDGELKPRRFTLEQSSLMAKMDGRNHKLLIAAQAKAEVPDLDSSSFLQFLTDTGMFGERPVG